MAARPGPVLNYRGPEGQYNAPPWDQRALAIPACAAVCVIVIFAYAGAGWVEVLYRLLTDGIIVLLWLTAAYGLGAILPLSDRSVEAAPLRAVTRVAAGLGAMSLLILGLGLAGGMNRVAAMALLCAGVAIAAWRLLQKRSTLSTRLRAWWHGRAGIAWLWIIVMPLLAMALVAAFVPPGVLWGDEPNGYDVVEYHLQVPREWYEAGRIQGLHHNVFSYFPFNVEMQFLLAMHLRGGPWAGMYLAQLMHVGYVALSVAAVYSAARATVGGRASATIAGVCAAGAPWLTLLAPVAYNEGGLLLYGTLAIGWTLHALRDTESRIASMAIAGAMAGLACGVKLTGVPMLLLPLPLLFISITTLRRESLRRVLIAPMFFGVVGVAVFAPWLMRNLVWTGNPVFPEAQRVFGRGHFTQVQSERWTAAHAPRTDQQGVGARLSAAWGQIAADARYGFLLLPLALACAAVAYGRAETWLLLALFGLLAVFWLGFTHLQSRFFVLAIPIAALLIGQVHGRATMVTGIAAAALAIIGIGVMHPRTMLWLHEKQVAGVLGIEALSEFMIPPIAKDVRADVTLALAGDAKAFCYQRPMARLRYRTVFDVPPDDDWLAAWVGEPAVSSNGQVVILIDPAELRRFSRTYRALPSVPADVLNRPEPFLLQR
ncbi:MAG TPA: hypothetical protein VGR35_18820 [Tepidisphaeraceae bacterium]|nr:hypothetical protein [Tepidisphaeraceae bacterium]